MGKLHKVRAVADAKKRSDKKAHKDLKERGLRGSPRTNNKTRL